LTSLLDRRPIVVALAGPNGAGKTMFFHTHLAAAGLRFVNTDVLARELGLEAMDAARVADAIRRELVRQRESFVFETVFSDPVGDKLAFLREAAATGFEVVLLFIGVSGPDVCEQRVSMRVSQGGHDVPNDRLVAPYPRTLANLREAIASLPNVIVFDNDDLAVPFRRVAEFEGGQEVFRAERVPAWFAPMVP
jgi:predicted ABC-type ATPase